MFIKRNILSNLGEDSDPIASAENLVDAIIVFACGLIVFPILYWNLQDYFFSDMTPEERSRVAEALKKAIAVEKGRQLEVPPSTASGKAGEGFVEMGTVYEDPQTGKLIMITP